MWTWGETSKTTRNYYIQCISLFSFVLCVLNVISLLDYKFVALWYSQAMLLNSTQTFIGCLLIRFFFLVLSKTCLYKNTESGLTGKASRRFFEHNCLCFKHKEKGKKTFDIQRENIAAWKGINHLQSLIVFQRRRNIHQGPG